MSIFKGIGEKLTNVGQDAVKKTKDLADIAKLNSQINSEETNIKNFYGEIGKLYCELYPNLQDEKLVSLRTMVLNSEKKISQYKDQVLEIRGVKKCPQCGEEITSAAAFCNSCGFNVALLDDKETEQEDEQKVCPKCNATAPKESVFCTNCGSRL